MHASDWSFWIRGLRARLASSRGSLGTNIDKQVGPSLKNLELSCAHYQVLLQHLLVWNSLYR